MSVCFQLVETYVEKNGVHLLLTVEWASLTKHQVRLAYILDPRFLNATLGEHLMAAYVVFTRERIIDPAEIELYRQKAPAAQEGHQLTPIAFYGNFEVLEGAAIEGAGILSFPSMEEARAWYRSPAYQEALKHRRLGSDYRIFLLQGV